MICKACSYNSLYNRISQPRENLRWPMNFKWTTCAARKPSWDWCKLQLFPPFSSQSLHIASALFLVFAIWQGFTLTIVEIGKKTLLVWEFLKAFRMPGSSWEFLGVPGSSLEFLGVPRCSSKFLRVSWSSLEFLEVPWSSSEFLEIPYSSLELLGVCHISLEFFGVP